MKCLTAAAAELTISGGLDDKEDSQVLPTRRIILSGCGK